MRVEWRPAAESDRANIMDYISRDNPRAALELDLEFTEKAKQAQANPTLYRTGRIRGTREIVVRANYVMVYKVDDKAKILTGLRVLHTARQFPT